MIRVATANKNGGPKIVHEVEKAPLVAASAFLRGLFEGVDDDTASTHSIEGAASRVTEQDGVDIEFDPVHVDTDAFRFVLEFLWIAKPSSTTTPATTAKEHMKPLARPLNVVTLAEHFNTPDQAPYAAFIGPQRLQEARNLLHAADFLGIQPLIDLCAAHIAIMLRGQSAKAVESALGLPAGYFTDQQKKQLEQANVWRTFTRFPS